MKTLLAFVFILSFVLPGPFPCMAGEAVLKGSKDLPLLYRMPGFQITGYSYSDFASHRFNDQTKKYVVVEGAKYYIEYKLEKGMKELGELKIRRNIQDALVKIGGTVVSDDSFSKTSTIVATKDSEETWVEVRSYDAMYRLTTVTRKGMEQEVVANAGKMGSDIHASGHVPVYGIYFDTGKADIRPESDAALAEIA